MDSRESLNVPPFGFVIDYMTYGGIYRDVYVEVCNQEHLEDVFVKPMVSFGKSDASHANEQDGAGERD